MKTPMTRPVSADAVETAIKNAAKMWEQGYTVRASQTVPGSFFVHKTNGEYYLVVTDAGFESCECEQWNREGVCKHQKFLQDWQAIAAGEEMTEERGYLETANSFTIL